MDVAEVIARHRTSIMNIPGVIGVAAGRSRDEPGALCIRVYTTNEAWPEDLPRQLDGYAVELVRKAREFRAR